MRLQSPHFFSAYRSQPTLQACPIQRFGAIDEMNEAVIKAIDAFMQADVQPMQEMRPFAVISQHSPGYKKLLSVAAFRITNQARDGIKLPPRIYYLFYETPYGAQRGKEWDNNTRFDLKCFGDGNTPIIQSPEDLKKVMDYDPRQGFSGRFNSSETRSLGLLINGDDRRTAFAQLPNFHFEGLIPSLASSRDAQAVNKMETFFQKLLDTRVFGPNVPIAYNVVPEPEMDI